MAGAAQSIQQIKPSIQAAQALLNDSNTLSQEQAISFSNNLEEANQQLLTMENFLKFRLIGQNISGYDKGVQALSGMITDVITSNRGYSAKIFDNRGRQGGSVFEVPISFKENTAGGPIEVIDREKQRQFANYSEQIKKERYLNSTELLEVPNPTNPQSIQSPQPFRRLQESVNYIDRYGKVKKGNLILKDNKLYLDNGREVMIRFGDHG